MSSERRLHPLTLVFELGGQIRHFAIPLAIGIIMARGGSDTAEWFLVPIAVLSMGTSIFHYATFRYRFDENELVVRSGLFVRSERHIPYERIQNIDAVQTIVHRACGVVTVLVQTGSGAAAEAKMAVVSTAALDEMRERVFARAGTGVGVGDAPAGTIAAARAPIADRTPHEVLLHLGPQELLLSGLIESRGLVVLGVGLAYLSQIERGDHHVMRWVTDRLPGLEQVGTAIAESFEQNHVPVRELLMMVALFFVAAVVLRVAAAIWTAVRLFDFRVSKHGEDLRIEHGFLTRVVNTIPLRRIQWVVVDETIFHRLLGRVAVRVTTAGGGAKVGRADREWLAPILPRTALASLIETVQPGLDLGLALRGAHPRGFWRAITVGTLTAIPIPLIVAWFSVAWAVLVFVLLEIRVVIGAVLLLRNLGWAATGTSVVFRGGRLRRHTAGARFSRLQTVTREESPFDRRTGMATVRVDTAGAQGAHLEMKYLPRADADELRELLVGKTVATEFVW